MRGLGRTGLALALSVASFAAVALFAFDGFGSERLVAVGSTKSHEEAIALHIAQLKSGKAQDRAAAAYWLGQQRSAAADAVETLVDLLGDATQVNPARYRASRALQKLTLGEEAAAALVNIGHPSIAPLIRVLKTSPMPEARKNAAWALGALHESGATTTDI
jgi:HEAT repeat protein